MLEWLQIIFLGHAHRWETSEVFPTYRVLKCSVCGKEQIVQIPSTDCAHVWSTVKTGKIKDDVFGVVGTYYEKECDKCGTMKVFNLK